MSTEGVVDITILGAGPVGLSAAYYAGHRDASVRIVESLEQLGGQVAATYPEKHVYDVAGHPKILGQKLVDLDSLPTVVHSKRHEPMKIARDRSRTAERAALVEDRAFADLAARARDERRRGALTEPGAVRSAAHGSSPRPWWGRWAERVLLLAGCRSVPHRASVPHHHRLTPSHLALSGLAIDVEPQSAVVVGPETAQGC